MRAKFKVIYRLWNALVRSIQARINDLDINLYILNKVVYILDLQLRYEV